MNSRIPTPSTRVVMLAVLALALAGSAAAQTDLLPTAQVVFPALPADEARVVSPTVTFGYVGTDPDGTEGTPLRMRFFFTEARTSGGTEIRTRADFEAHVDELVDFADSNWSPWMDYPATEEQRRITFPNLASDRYYLFAVQTRDADGAVSTGRGYQVEVAHILVSEGLPQPVVTLTEYYLGSSTSSLLAYDLAAGQPLNFSWTATADAYGGTIVSYRYGWDIADPADPYDPGWAVPPGLENHAPERTFQDGMHVFTLHVVDDAGTVARLERQLRVIPYVDLPNQLPLLVIDQVVDAGVMNWPDAQGNPRNDETYRNAYWQFLADASGGVPGFDWERDRFDHRDQVTYADLVAYRAVLCYARANTQQLMFNQFRPVGDRDRYVWLAPYQLRGGNLMLVGGASMESFLEIRPNYMAPLVFDTFEEFYDVLNLQFVVGFGAQTLPDGAEVRRGTIMYPFATAGIATLDWTSQPSKYVYGEPLQTMRQMRHEDCAGVKALALDDGFRTNWSVAPGDLADTLFTDPVIDWQDAVYAAADTLDIIHNTFPFRDDEFVDANITTRPTGWAPQTCAEGPGGLCVEPMLRGVARFDWLRETKWADGDPAWPASEYTPTELEERCGEAALEPFGELPLGSARTNDQVFGWLSYRMAGEKPTGQPDVYWGFDPYRFDNNESKKAIRWVLKEVFLLDVLGP